MAAVIAENEVDNEVPRDKRFLWVKKIAFKKEGAGADMGGPIPVVGIVQVIISRLPSAILN